ncbi:MULTISPECIES: hypothetical protein [Nocardiaceae]|uniref:hypothetical protein n=1 Tax=Nocardiaceae TaxID=85025 RepID=UPI0005230566|nr:MULTISPECIES: hypothetical protein [Rhodococcus]
MLQSIEIRPTDRQALVLRTPLITLVISTTGLALVTPAGSAPGLILVTPAGSAPGLILVTPAGSAPGLPQLHGLRS